MNGPMRITRRDLIARAAAAAASLWAGRALAHPRRAKWKEGFELVVGFEINQAISRVHRPYVAVTIEDPRGNPVRTVSLWVNKSRGDRWIPDLHRWWRNERERQRASAGDLVATASSATRSGRTTSPSSSTSTPTTARGSGRPTRRGGPAWSPTSSGVAMAR